MSSTVIVVKHTEPLGVQSRDRKELLRKVITMLESANGGTKRVDSIDVHADASADPAAALAVVTCASVLAADTVSINGVVFTAVAGAPAANQFDQSGTDTADATSLAAGINASVSALVQGLVVASSNGAAVTISATQKGKAGNAMTIATSNGARLAITGGLSRLGGGTGGDVAAVSMTP